MREDIKQWIDALRSGEYKQCQLQLSDGEGYCCLGVYAKLNGMEFVSGEEALTGTTVKVDSEVNERLYNKLIQRFKYTEYVDMNDEGKSFKEIANQIEEDFS